MTPEHFIRDYTAALATQQWANVEPLIHSNCSVTFSSGALHQGMAAIRQAYEHNFAIIKNEDYRMSRLHWITKTDTKATYTFDFSWSGTINGLPASGNGKGKATLVCIEGKWMLMEEQLYKHTSPAP
mgnify:CR=1 FL=1